MNRPKTHRWLWWYVFGVLGSFVGDIWAIFSSAVKAEESTAFFVIVSVGVLAEGLLFYGLLFRKKWGWRLNFFRLAVLPIAYIQFIDEKELGYATGDHLLASALIFVLIFILPNWIYFKKRKHLFDDGKGPHKMLFRGFRVLDSQGSEAEGGRSKADFGNEDGLDRKDEVKAVVSGSNEMQSVSKEEAEDDMNDDAFYDEVAKEIENDNLVRGVWTRAFAEADGDENRAKAIYIKLRVSQLSEEKSRLEKQKQEKINGEEAELRRRIRDEVEWSKKTDLLKKLEETIENPEEDQETKAFVQWQAEEKDLSPRVDMEGKSNIKGCAFWILIAIVSFFVLMLLVDYSENKRAQSKSSSASAVKKVARKKVPQEGVKWTGNLGGGVVMEFVPIPAGSFLMGSNNVDSEKPVHRVTLSQPFWMAKTEVTQAQYEKMMGNNPSYFKGASYPVEYVSWNDAMVFCRKLTERLPAGLECTLPTEAQWEYACRAGTTDDYVENLDAVAWYRSNSGMKPHPVGTKQPNAWGVYDMHGNVMEWCLDDWHGSYDGAPSDGSRWGNGSGLSRVARDGTWGLYASYCRSTSRGDLQFDYTSLGLGFRVCVVRK